MKVIAFILLCFALNQSTPAPCQPFGPGSILGICAADSYYAVTR